MNEEIKNEPEYKLPNDMTMRHASRLAIVEDKPIMFDYYADSCVKKVIIGIRDSGDDSDDENEKLLVKSEDEYTSPIKKIYKVEEEYIIITENSIYIVANCIENKKISS
jgi:hypothetical protein